MRVDLHNPLYFFLFVDADGAIDGLKPFVVDQEPGLVCFQNRHEYRLVLFVMSMVSDRTGIGALIIAV